MNFGERLRCVLEEKDITQKEFAEQINIAPTTLNGYINDKREPNLALVCTISKKLGVSVDYLLGSENSLSALSVTETQIICNYRRMSESRKKILLQLSEELSENAK